MRFFTNKNWKRHIIKKCVKRAAGILDVERDSAFVEKVYTTRWLSPFSREPRLALRGNIEILKIHEDFSKDSVWFVAHLIRSVGATSVLELGSGNGLFSAALKILNPNVEYHGIELTEQGIIASQHLLETHMESLIYITEKSSREIKDILQGPLKFDKGDMCRLPYGNNAFDFVFSHTAIEQMPRTYLLAFREAHRVTRRYACFIEEFREAQKNIFQRLTLWANDYFRASYRSLEKAGFAVLSFDVKEVDKASHSVGMAVCEKKVTESGVHGVSTDDRRRPAGSVETARYFF